MPIGDYPSNVKMYKDGKARNIINALTGNAENKEECTIDVALRQGWSLTRPGEVSTAPAPKFPLRG